MRVNCGFTRGEPPESLTAFATDGSPQVVVDNAELSGVIFAGQLMVPGNDLTIAGVVMVNHGFH